MIKIGYTEYKAIVITDQYDRVVCIIDTDEEGNGMVVERKGIQAHFIESEETDFRYRVNYNDDCIIVNDKDKFLS